MPPAVGDGMLGPTFGGGASGGFAGFVITSGGGAVSGLLRDEPISGCGGGGGVVADFGRRRIG